jgi:hypothetical protein
MLVYPAGEFAGAVALGIVAHGVFLGVWDTGSDAWWSVWAEAVVRAKTGLPDSDATYRAEFYLLDGPVALTWRWERNVGVNGQLVSVGPFVCPLESLPPARLLKA